MSDVLVINHLKTYFKTKHGMNPAVDDISLRLQMGKITALVGESGSGKSMTAMSILGLIPKPSGVIMPGSEILFEGKDLTTLKEREIAKIRGNKIAMIFQEPMTSLNPVYTIGKQLTEPLRVHQKLSKQEAKKIAISYLEKVRIPDPEKRFNNYPHQLSGGLRQRVMIAMAMICEPKLIIADEPTTALDVTIQAQILSLLCGVQKDLDTAILFITHDLGVVAEISDTVCVMYAGQIVEQADVKTLFDKPMHPYTKGLLKSLPRVDDDVTELYSIKGMVPNLIHLPKGCRFASRCPEATAICHQEIPPREMVSRDHEVFCWLPRKEVSNV
ncbi:ABC transporter ATP-binding protein [Fusibacter paucivorans]|uniref:ABC transporter ATP-binding protein n=1 Tax=Fusibacter paucivorans TaxID=76009 RepID=A0ABS5PQY0_9FIRM|nr:ABC transporter ATP-binding protein [Fusibacter paucivorans]MBS7527317.1 ABC transporter ATP-binding protein [Fusibacter paucivorans]